MTDWARDRIEIDDLLVRYSTAIDTKDFDLLDEVFTPDADCDYQVVGGFRGDRAAFKAWLSEVMGFFEFHMHYVTNRAVDLDGDEATAVSYLYNPCRLQGGDDGPLRGRPLPRPDRAHRRRLADHRPPRGTGLAHMASRPPA